MTKKERRKLQEKRAAGKLVGECNCGHLETLHTDSTSYKDRTNRLTVKGHGGCAASGCPCPQFTWVNWQEVQP